MAIKINLQTFIIAQIDELIPTFGETRSEVIQYVISNWLHDHPKAFEYAERVKEMVK